MKKSNLVMRKVGELKNHPINGEIYEMYDIEGLKSSISEVGLLENLVIDQDNQVISGNRRLAALKELGVEDVLVQQVNVNVKDVPYLLFCHNKSRVKSFQEKLNEIKLLEMKFKVGSGRGKKKSKGEDNYNWREIVAKEMGMSTGQLNKFLKVSESDQLVGWINENKITINQAYNHIERVEKMQNAIEERNFKPEDYVTDNIRIYTQSSASLPQIMDGEVQCIFTSPPYANGLRDYGVKGLGEEATIDHYVNNLVEHFAESIRCLNENGSFFLNIADSYINRSLACIPQLVAIGLMKKYGLLLRNTIIWHKTNGKPGSGKNKLTQTYEYIFHFTKCEDYYYDHTQIPTLGKSNHPSIPYHKSKPNEISISPIISKGMKNLGDYWTEDVVTSAVANHHYAKELGIMHPAPFPEVICILPILQTTKPGDIVMDPFMGLGTVLRVASSLGRIGIGVDLQPNFTGPVVEDFKRRLAA